MKKYVIRNCPALVGCRAEQDLCYKNELHKCQDCNDCVLKQIVKQAGYCLCPEILELLDIEEVE